MSTQHTGNGFVSQGISTHHQIRQVERVGLANWFAYGIGVALRKLVQGLWSIRVTLFWTAFTIFALTRSNMSLFGMELLIMGLLVYGATRNRKWLQLMPLIGDYVRGRAVRSHRELVTNGNDLLERVGIRVVTDGIENESVTYREHSNGNGVLIIREPIPNYSYTKIVSQLEEHKDGLNAVRLYTQPYPAGDKEQDMRNPFSKNKSRGIKVTVFRNDPLDEPVTISEPASLDPKKMRVKCATNSVGQPEYITFGDTSGMVIGGVPGSGKTAGATSFLLPLALSEYVNLSVIDGKGGMDWAPYEDVCDTFIRGDEDLAPIDAFLTSAVAKMNHRMTTMNDLVGESNYWNADPDRRLAAGVKLELIVIDECQGVFESRKNDSNANKLVQNITRSVSTLIKRGRSAGMMVILMTQKPTADSLPTAIRDNCGLSLAFRLTRAEATKAVLGELPDDAGVPLPTNIPATRKGGAVMATDEGKLTECRFYYMDEHKQEKIIADSPKARRMSADIQGVEHISSSSSDIDTTEQELEDKG